MLTLSKIYTIRSLSISNILIKIIIIITNNTHKKNNKCNHNYNIFKFNNKIKINLSSKTSLSTEVSVMPTTISLRISRTLRFATLNSPQRMEQTSIHSINIIIIINNYTNITSITTFHPLRGVQRRVRSTRSGSKLIIRFNKASSIRASFKYNI